MITVPESEQQHFESEKIAPVTRSLRARRHSLAEWWFCLRLPCKAWQARQKLILFDLVLPAQHTNCAFPFLIVNDNRYLKQ